LNFEAAQSGALVSARQIARMMVHVYSQKERIAIFIFPRMGMRNDAQSLCGSEVALVRSL
jgi:hypothetical protein